MKTSSFLKVVLFGFILTLPFLSCQHKTTTAVPGYPLAGKWTGTTAQNQPITITVDHIDTGFFITSYDFSI